MPARVKLLPVEIEPDAGSLGDYVPEERKLSEALDDLLWMASEEIAPGVFGRRRTDQLPLELKTTFSRLEPDTDERPFASVQVVIEVYRRPTRDLLYTHKVETEVRRLIQNPTPIDDPGFNRTALGRATLSCMRSMFSAVMQAFGEV